MSIDFLQKENRVDRGNSVSTVAKIAIVATLSRHGVDNSSRIFTAFTAQSFDLQTQYLVLGFILIILTPNLGPPVERLSC